MLTRGVLIDWLTAGQLVTTLFMVGLIWFVQVVHYPMFANVGSAEFAVYERVHQQRTTWVVAPLMLIELGTAAGLLIVSYGTWQFSWYVVGAVLLAVIWFSTALLQVPQHSALKDGFRTDAHRVLVSSNWVRTAAWSCRGVLVTWLTITS